MGHLLGYTLRTRSSRARTRPGGRRNPARASRTARLSIRSPLRLRSTALPGTPKVVAVRRQPVTPRPVSRSRSILYVMRRRGWLRPRRIGCLLILLVIVGIAALWALGWAVDGVADRFRVHPTPGAG